MSPSKGPRYQPVSSRLASIGRDVRPLRGMLVTTDTQPSAMGASRSSCTALAQRAADQGNVADVDPKSRGV